MTCWLSFASRDEQFLIILQLFDNHIATQILCFSRLFFGYFAAVCYQVGEVFQIAESNDLTSGQNLVRKAYMQEKTYYILTNL